MNGKYLQAKNKSTYPPQEKNPKGEVHEDWGLFSYDRGRKQFILRQFHVEGFINQYALDRAASNDKTLVFVLFQTFAEQSLRPGARARSLLPEQQRSPAQMFRLHLFNAAECVANLL